ncbi:phosphomannose isomerase type II C-terminal cupin domain [Nitratireductor sp. XY-223]|uniref:phosphomannose isomerase type II C-terminal cupin domain n=1 Tax=Nitratireductor sp. XY-223 TaxID=2561926 RepID=UPI0010AAB3A8|nr:phosphomannose isomerase type II C-terminal cupin domain [Nitratireductor sp. XY-223]
MNDPRDCAAYATGQSDVRPWGRWLVVDKGADFAVKRIEVNPGQRLSLQYHAFRSEHWIIVGGKGAVSVDGREWTVKTGSYVFVPKSATHRVHNTGPETLVLLEVQTGERLRESDIVRIEDDYSR